MTNATHFRNVIFISFFYLLTFQTTKAQQLKENQPMNLNGLELVFKIVNKQSVTIKNDNFERYEVLLSAKNNSDKSINIRFSKYPDPNTFKYNSLVEFFCVNATGARLTPKKVTLRMRQHNIEVTYQTTNKDNKKVNQSLSAIAGYYFDSGDVLTEKAIFIVPKGQTPEIQALDLLKS